MNTVMVIISSYNGEKYIREQIESIIRQSGIRTKIFVRDDGSTDATIEILKKMQDNYDELIISQGENIGWEQSFILALKSAPDAEYYAFCDQDDIWMPDKLINGVSKIREREKLSSDKAILYHCNKLSVDEDLKPLPHQVRRTPRPLNRENAMTQEYAQGCSIIINRQARNLVLRHIPNEQIAHDFWTGLICYMFGEIIYDDRRMFYHISHVRNASGEGHMLRSWHKRMIYFFSESPIYYRPWNDLLLGYHDLLSETDIVFINRLCIYKKSLKNKIYLLVSRKFVRDSIIGTVSLKVSILLNRL